MPIIASLWKASSRPLLKVGSARAGFLGLRFEYLQGWRLLYLSRQSVPMFDHLHKTRMLNPVFKGNLFYFNLRAPLPLLSPDTLQGFPSGTNKHG